jgi:hypothetical protein
MSIEARLLAAEQCLDTRDRLLDMLTSNLGLLTDRVDGMNILFEPMYCRLQRLLKEPTAVQVLDRLFAIPAHLRQTQLWTPEYKKMYYDNKFGWKVTGVFVVKNSKIHISKPGVDNVSEQLLVLTLACNSIKCSTQTQGNGTGFNVCLFYNRLQ